MCTIKRPVNYPKYKAENGWLLVGAHCQDGAGTLFLTDLPLKAVNGLIIYINDQITFKLPTLQDQKSLALCWSWFLWHSSDVIATILAQKGSQYIVYV